MAGRVRAAHSVPMLVAFWNINTGKGSDEGRKDTLARWCSERDPAILFLEEVSHTIADTLEDLTEMEPITNVETKDWKFQASTKEIWALQSTGAGFVGKAMRLPGYGKGIRMGIKLTNKQQQMVIWGIHANASSSGGRLAVDSATQITKSDPTAIVGGDFNRAFASATKLQTTRTFRCQSWQNNPLLFSQWRKAQGKEMEFPNGAFHLDKRNCGTLSITPTKKGVIDFVIAGRSRTVTAALNCRVEQTWVDILRYFDHCPVVFEIG